MGARNMATTCARAQATGGGGAKDGSEASDGLRRHLRAASVTLSGSGKRRLVKPEDNRRVDAAAALTYAHAARVRAIRDGWSESASEPVVVWG